MGKLSFFVLFVLVFAGTPVLLALDQGVPTRSTYQQAVLLGSLAAFGLMLGQFWLSRLLPRGASRWTLAGLLRWHKVLGYTVGTLLLTHPFLMIARRFWIQESEPLDNLWTMLQAPALLPAIVAWLLLLSILLLAVVRSRLRHPTWRVLHGLLASAFLGLAAWHAIAIGRHSTTLTTTLLIALVAASVASLLLSWVRPRMRARPNPNLEGRTA